MKTTIKTGNIMNNRTISNNITSNNNTINNSNKPEVKLKGLVLYNEEDIINNTIEIDWLLKTSTETVIDLDLMYLGGIKGNYQGLLSEHDFVINRTGDFGLAMYLEMHGMAVYNNSQVTLLANNKMAGYKYVNNLGYDIAMNPENGAEINNQVIIEGGSSKHTTIANSGIKITGLIRAYVIGNRIVYLVNRDREQLENNSEIYKPTKREMRIMENIMNGLDIDNISMDFYTTTTGTLLFTGFNDMDASEMICKHGTYNTSEIFLGHILSKYSGV